MYVIIAGAGRIGQHLAKTLSEEQQDVVVIDKNGDICHEIATELEIITIRGDATKPKVLEEAGIKESDSFIALTGSDEANLIISLMAKQMGARQVVTRLGALHYNESILRKLGIDLIVYPEAAAAAYISEIITKPEVLKLGFMSKGDSEIIEVEANKKIIGKKIRDFRLPENCSIIALYNKKGEMTTPKPNTVIKKGNKILVLTKIKKSKSIKKMFGAEEE